MRSPLTPQIMDPIRKVAAQVYPGLPSLPMQETFATDSGRPIAVGIPGCGVSGLLRGADGGNIHGLNEHIGVQAVMEGREFPLAAHQGLCRAEAVRRRVGRRRRPTRPALS